MKNAYYQVCIVIITFFSLTAYTQEIRPRVFVFTDINIDAGDPDDRQSLVHLLWYANDLNITGIVPDRWDAQGLEACFMVLQAYEKDFNVYQFRRKGYPSPRSLKKNIATDLEHAELLFVEAASAKNAPLYVLIWGNMVHFGNILSKHPSLSENIRVITIGTHLMMEAYREHLPESWKKTKKPCEQYNWNGFGRNELYKDGRCKNMWWLEINWTYEGMFTGEQPREMYQKLSAFGALGAHMTEITKNQPWASYFRVGDTPSVLFLIDPDNDLGDPTHGSWAGRFTKPFPEQRPNYYTDENGPIEWDYEKPCNTWANHVKMRDHAKGTLEEQRPEMYKALIDKLKIIYDK